MIVDEFFSTIDFSDDEARRQFISLFKEASLAEDEVLFDCNEPADKLYFLKEGHLAVHKYTGFLKNMQVIALLDPCTVVGEAALLQSHVRTTRVTAIVDSKLTFIKRKEFSHFQKQFPESSSCFLQYLFSIVSLRLEKTSERLARIL
ncbi:MAG TPA: cyclic nucleotide-binding domain-containing protein [Desulfobacterales bacterium]|nr:cyclic nucleotide-binding domain-containing protein [Desulfobacterales bacterium]HIP38739.1 cyclic nucleotide-binding domain-containing protein [Desulfocapsa sulfexigens]